MISEKPISKGATGSEIKRLPCLDAIRGIAILFVLGQHSPAVVRVHPIVDAIPNYLQMNGYLGVDLFFVLSGYLIGGILFAEYSRRGSIDVPRFLIRRAFKIWPAYLASLTACCLALIAVGRYADGTPATAGEVFGDMGPAYLHAQNYFRSTGHCIWFWSLGVEEHFYLALPLVLLLALARNPADGRKNVRRVFGIGIATAVTCLVLRGIAKANHPVLDNYYHYFPTHLRIDSLMAGVA